MKLLNIVPIKNPRIFIGLETIVPNEIEMDVDLSLICFNAEGKVHCTSYLEKSNGGEAIKLLDDEDDGNEYFLHKGISDNVTDVIDVHLNEIPDIQSMKIIISLFRGNERKQDFSMGKYTIYIADPDNNQTLLEYELEGDFIGKTGIFVANIYRNNNVCWMFKPIGEGVNVRNMEEMFLMNEYDFRRLQWQPEMPERGCKKNTNCFQKLFGRK